MYENMWQFINPDMISYILNINVSYKKDIYDYKFKKQHKNTICFKGDEDDGHYVFVDDKLNDYGTIEKIYFIDSKIMEYVMEHLLHMLYIF